MSPLVSPQTITMVRVVDMAPRFQAEVVWI